MGETSGVDIRAIAFDVNGTLIDIRTDQATVWPNSA